MSLLAGILRIEDTTPLTALQPEQVTIAVNQLLARYEAERDQYLGLLVDGEVVNPQISYTLGAIDEGQEIGPDGRPLETRPFGKVNVAFPLKRIGWATGWNYETFAYLTLADLETLTAARQGGNARRHVREVFKAVFNNVNYTFTDDRHGDLTIRRLANDDTGTLYPPAFGSDAEANDNHYLASGYAATAISATNNPFATLKAEIIEHFDTTTAVVAIINPAQRTEVLTDLTNFVDGPTAGITLGDDTAVANAVGVNVPASFLGVDGDSGVYVFVDDRQRIPANYIFAAAVGPPPPLKRRVPEAESLRGFKLEADEAHYPLFKRTYVDRWGYAVANRLGAAVMFLDAGAEYVVPAAYA